MEALIIAVWVRRQEIAFQTARAQIQALLSQQGADDETIQKAFEDLKQCFFPYLANAQQEQKKQMRDVLEREVRRGPLAVVPQVDLFKPTIASKLAKGEKALQQRAALLQQGQLTNMDPFRTARRKTRRRGAS